MRQDSQLVTALVQQVHGFSNLVSTPSRTFVFLAEWQRVSGLLVQVLRSACETLQSIRCSTGSFDKFHTLENSGSSPS